MFSPADIETFHISSWQLDHETGSVSLNYAFDDAYVFTETIRLPPSSHLPDNQRDALESAVAILHLVAGVSYFKAAAPSRIVVDSGPISEAMLALTKSLYTEGLGEFAYTNSIRIPSPSFEVTTRAAKQAHSLDLDAGALVAVGGGKDSCTSIELLRNAGITQTLASVNHWRAIDETIAAAQLPSVHATRTISPMLLDLNKQGALNGHVPVTAIVSMILVALAIIGGNDAVVMSNERSASTGNLEHDGVLINHQFSKSFSVERMLADLIAHEVAADIAYFSLLRPLSELDIARRFSDTTRYDSVFTSCNRAFRIDDHRRIDHWCCDCPKCRFVFLALAPFIGRERLTQIFGRNMLDDSTQAAGFDELIGWNANKPFECVGEIEESVAAFILLSASNEWMTSALVTRFRDEIHPQLIVPPDVTTRPFVLSGEHLIPEKYRKALDET